LAVRRLSPVPFPPAGGQLLLPCAALFRAIAGLHRLLLLQLVLLEQPVLLDVPVVLAVLGEPPVVHVVPQVGRAGLPVELVWQRVAVGGPPERVVLVLDGLLRLAVPERTV